MKYSFNPAPPWEQLGISEEEWNKLQREVEQLTHSASAQKPIDPNDPSEHIQRFGHDAPPTRKPRSDKDTPRTPKAQMLSVEAVSAMSTDQVQELIRLVGARNERLKNWEDAQKQAQRCEADFKHSSEALLEFIEALAVPTERT